MGHLGLVLWCLCAATAPGDAAGRGKVKPRQPAGPYSASAALFLLLGGNPAVGFNPALKASL